MGERVPSRPTFGGLGGVIDGRPRDHGDEFENAIERALGDQMRADPEVCCEVWSALANVVWIRQHGATAGYSFRAAGDLVAAVLGRGNYMDWYGNNIPDSVGANVALDCIK